ncbi:MAG: alpha/beta hydrolase, partial [Candidatus Dormibacteraceae bacterium]
LRARRQVWLAAFVPDGRRGLLEEVSVAPADIFNPEWIGKDPTSDPVLATHFLFHDGDLKTLTWALTTLRRFSPRTLSTEPIALAPGIPSAYVVAGQDRTLRPDWCGRQAAHRLHAELVEIQGGYCPHVSRAEELATILDDLAARSPG